MTRPVSRTTSSFRALNDEVMPLEPYMNIPLVKLPDPPKDPVPHFVGKGPGWMMGALCVDRLFRLLSLCIWLLGTGGAGYMLVHHWWP